jgi:hypothetical protein
MANFSFPVFGSAGEEGELSAPAPKPRTPDGPRLPGGFKPVGQGAACDHEYFHYQDASARAEAQQQRIDEQFRKADPQLFDARLKLERCRQTKADWSHQLTEAKFSVSRAVAAMAGTSPDSPTGTIQERRHQLDLLRGQLADCEAEYQAACEEVATAKAAVDALTKVTP